MRRREVTILPEALRQWRNLRKLNQRDLARKASEFDGATVSESLIAAIETGLRQPSLLNAQGIADALSVPLRAIAIVHAKVDLPGEPPSAEAIKSLMAQWRDEVAA